MQHKQNYLIRLYYGYCVSPCIRALGCSLKPNWKSSGLAMARGMHDSRNTFLINTILWVLACGLYTRTTICDSPTLAVYTM
jgi:hypothetical protein